MELQYFIGVEDRRVAESEHGILTWHFGEQSAQPHLLSISIVQYPYLAHYNQYQWGWGGTCIMVYCAVLHLKLKSELNAAHERSIVRQYLPGAVQ